MTRSLINGVAPQNLAEYPPPWELTQQRRQKMAETCSATRTDGAPCRAPAMETGFCFWHDPQSRAARRSASSRGGSRKTVELPSREPLTADRCRELLAGVVEAVLHGSLDQATARTVGYLLQVEARLREGGEIEARLAVLERALVQEAA